MGLKQCLLCEATSAGTMVRFRKNAQVCRWCDAELKKTARAYCRKCYAAHPLAEMHRHYCAACDKAQRAAYRAKHLDRERARSRAYIRLHPHRETPAQRHARYLRNRAQHSAACRAYRARRGVWMQTYMRAYHQARYAADPLYYVKTKQRAKVRMFRRMFAR